MNRFEIPFHFKTGGYIAVVHWEGPGQDFTIDTIDPEPLAAIPTTITQKDLQEAPLKLDVPISVQQALAVAIKRHFDDHDLSL